MKRKADLVQDDDDDAQDLARRLVQQGRTRRGGVRRYN